MPPKFKPIPLHTGDVVMIYTPLLWYNPITWLSWLIRKLSGSKYNHVGVIISVWGMPMLYESVGVGVRSVVAINRMMGYRVKILRPNYLVPNYYHKEPELAKRATELLGITKYDYSALLLYQLIYQLTGRWIGSDRENANDKRMVCSEFVAYIHRDIFKDEWYRTDPQDFEDLEGIELEKIYENIVKEGELE